MKRKYCIECAKEIKTEEENCNKCNSLLLTDYKSPLKAASLSLFFGPGFGQFYVKRHGRGIIFISSFLYSLFIILQKFFTLYSQYHAKMYSADREIAISAIREFYDKAINLDLGTYANFFFIIWIISIIDAYMITKLDLKKLKHDKNIHEVLIENEIDN